LFPQELADQYRRDDLRVINERATIDDTEENPAPDGSMRYVQVVKTPLIERDQVLGVQGVFWDVTPRIASERKAEVHRQRLNWAASVTRDTIWDSNLETDTVWWSEGINKVWGYAEADVGPRSDWWQNRIHGQDRQWVLKSVELAKSGNDESWSGEYRCRDARGNYRHILDRARIIRDDAGKPTRMVGSHMDITERKRMENALVQSEERFRAFMAYNPGVAWVNDHELKHQYVNLAFEELFGRKSAAIMGHDDNSIHDPEAAARTMALDREVLESNQPQQILEHTVGENGKDRYWLVNKFPFVGDNAEIWVGGMAVDVTQRIEAENSLRQSEGRLKLMSQASGDAVWDHNTFNGQTWRNDAYVKLLGENSTTGKSALTWWKGRIHPEDRTRVSAALRECLANPQARRWSDEYRFRGANGQYLFVQEHAYIERDKSGKHIRIVGTMRDLSPIHAAQEEQLRIDHKMQEAQKLESLGVLAGGIAHDFNNLLTAILGNINLAQIDIPPSSPIHSYLSEVERSSIRAAELCKQMLAYSGRGRFVISHLSLSDLIAEMKQLLGISISKQAVFKYHLAENLPQIAADATQIRQIVMNMVTNASEAIGEKSGLITITTGLMRADRDYLNSAHLSPEIPEADYVCIEVADTGVGMDELTLSKVFDPFFTTKFTGRGLGMAAVLGIVRGHSGAIKVESAPLKGTRFKLLLPCANNESPEEPVPANRLPPRPGTGMILVIDDEETVRTTAARILETGGYTVALAPDGREGLQVFKETMDELRLVLLDLTMPHLDGVETFQEIRKIRQDIPVVLMSGYNEQEAVQLFIGKGLAGFIQKPFQVHNFLEHIGRAVDATP
jgi:two-component system cell cycle sensor histidine kinase/response regulator CckA